MCLKLKNKNNFMKKLTKNNWIWWSFIREKKKKLPARHKDFPANSVSTWPLYDSMNLGGIQSSAMARAIKLPKMVGASGVSRTKSSRFFIKKSNAERKKQTKTYLLWNHNFFYVFSIRINLWENKNAVRFCTLSTNLAFSNTPSLYVLWKNIYL